MMEADSEVEKPLIDAQKSPENGNLVDKSSSWLRWPVLLLSCIMLLGSYYCFDIPSALKSQIYDYMGDEADYETEFALMYTLYAVPNVILPLFGGLFVDAFGVCLSLLLCTALLTGGQVVMCIGFAAKNWPIILLGRVIFGLGGENLIVASSALLAEWFKGKELAFSFGINLAVARLGGIVNNILSPYLVQHVNLMFAMWFGAFVCCLSVVSVIITWPIDARMNALIKKQKEGKDTRGTYVAVEDTENVMSQPAGTNLINNSTSITIEKKKTEDGDNEEEGEIVKPSLTCRQEVHKFWEEVKSLPHVFWILAGLCVVMYGAVLPFNNVASTVLLERDYFIATPDNCPLEYSGQCQSDSNPPVCDLASNYAPPLPTNITINGVYYNQLESQDVDCNSDNWKAGCTQTYCDDLSHAQSKAALIMSIPYTISGFLSPIIGIGIDIYGLRATLSLMSAAVVVVVHILLGFTNVTPIGPLCGQGLAYTCFAAVLWPAIPLVIDEELTGLAFGIATSAYNAACAIIPVAVAQIYMDSDNLYIPNVEILFICLGICGTALGVYLVYYDQYIIGGILDKGLPEDERPTCQSIGNSLWYMLTCCGLCSSKTTEQQQLSRNDKNRVHYESISTDVQ